MSSKLFSIAFLCGQDDSTVSAKKNGVKSLSISKLYPQDDLPMLSSPTPSESISSNNSDNGGDSDKGSDLLDVDKSCSSDSSSSNPKRYQCKSPGCTKSFTTR